MAKVKIVKKKTNKKSELNQIYGASAVSKAIALQEIGESMKNGELSYIDFTFAFAEAVHSIVNAYEHLIDDGTVVSPKFLEKVLFVEDALEYLYDMEANPEWSNQEPSNYPF